MPLPEDHASSETAQAHFDRGTAELVELAIRRQEGSLAQNGALIVSTGDRTRRQPLDSFIVREPSTAEAIDWGPTHRSFDPDQFDALWFRVTEHLSERERFVIELHAGAENEYYLPLTLTAENAWHTLFARNLLITPPSFNPKGKEVWRIVSAASFICEPERDGTNSDAAVIINFAQRKILLAGMRLAGELKNAIFVVQSFLLPEKDVLPMHCAATLGRAGDVTLLFGVSGAGKTTLSTDPERALIGDDEHGWAREAVFNLEGGCYAKCANLSEESSPLIWNAIRFGSILENVVMDHASRIPDYHDLSLSSNARASYPRSHLASLPPDNRARRPAALIFLTCDPTGLIPPVAILSKAAAVYHFLAGYTATPVSGPDGQEYLEPGFSSCYDVQYFPRQPAVYADLLTKRLMDFEGQVYLVNTGWTGGSDGKGGSRIPLSVTRQIISTIQSGDIARQPTGHVDVLNLTVPLRVDGVASRLLQAREAWLDKSAHDRALIELARKFIDNFKRFDVAAEIINAGPRL